MTIEKDIEAIRSYLNESPHRGKPFAEFRRVEAALARPEPRGGRYISSTEQSQIDAILAQVTTMIREIRGQATAKDPSTVADGRIASLARTYVKAMRDYNDGGAQWRDPIVMVASRDALIDAVDGRPQPKGAIITPDMMRGLREISAQADKVAMAEDETEAPKETDHEV
jgi:hypothetical protein